MGGIRRHFKRFLLKVFYRKLGVQITVMLLVIVTIPLVLLGVLLLKTSHQAVRSAVLSNNKEIVIRASKEIGSFIGRAEDIINTTGAMIGAIYPAPWKQETMLVEVVLSHPIFMRVVSVDLSGRELASSELRRGLRWSYSDEALLKVKKRKKYISQVKILNNYTPYVTMAVPIKRGGKIVGALIADADLRGMWTIVDNIKIGKTGRVFLVSNDGTLIAHQDKKRVLKRENFMDEKDVRAVLDGKSESVEIEDELKRKWISSYTAIPGLNWGVVLRQEQSEAYRFSRVMKTQSWIIIILSELVVIVVSIFMSKVLTRPIKTLVSRIKKVSSGDLNHKIEIKRHDEIGELIRAFNDMTNKLKKAKAREKFSIIGETASWIAHELKNSLVSIKAFVQLFPLRHKDKNYVDKFSKLLPGEIYRWECMIKELSDFSSHSKLKITQTNVKEILESTLDIMADKLNKKGINVHLNLENENFNIIADPLRLKQVFVNLIINAINAMPDSGSLMISMCLIHRKDFSLKRDPLLVESNLTDIELRIKDSGRGIEEDVLDKIFEPFYSGKKGGTGLGLAISRKIIEEHNGSINAESKVGVGTTFIVKLPVNVIESKYFNKANSVNKKGK